MTLRIHYLHRILHSEMRLPHSLQSLDPLEDRIFTTTFIIKEGTEVVSQGNLPLRSHQALILEMDGFTLKASQGLSQLYIMYERDTVFRTVSTHVFWLHMSDVLRPWYRRASVT
jgi:hypothetical protein